MAIQSLSLFARRGSSFAVWLLHLALRADSVADIQFTQASRNSFVREPATSTEPLTSDPGTRLA